MNCIPAMHYYKISIDICICLWYSTSKSKECHMELTYTGKPIRVSVTEYAHATDWMLSRLVSKKLKKNLSVEISLRKIKGLNG
ncbi:MAG: hypothetical protein ACKO96_11530, partial [Flammeovirgaceae bacterium]